MKITLDLTEDEEKALTLLHEHYEPFATMTGCARAALNIGLVEYAIMWKLKLTKENLQRLGADNRTAQKFNP